MKSKMFSKFVDTHLVPGLPWESGGKNLPANAGDAGPTAASGRSTGRRSGNPPQYSCLRNPRAEEPGRLYSMRLQKSWT